MYMVYWTDIQEQKSNARSKEFSTELLGEVLSFIESLRVEQRRTGMICHITLSAENPQSVGRAGVAEPSDDYDWKKRRV